MDPPPHGPIERAAPPDRPEVGVDDTTALDLGGLDRERYRALRPDPPPRPGPDAARHVRIFGSHAFFRLWIVQVVSSFGDWLGFIAIIAIAADLGGEDAGAAAAISLVLIPRILPGLFLASAGGVIVDRLNRKRLMVACDVSRAGLILLVPLADSLVLLVVLSFLIEIATSLWAPAKEAIVPNVTPASHLATANSLNLVATYGTIPLAAAAFAGLAAVSDRLVDVSWFEWVDGPRLALGLDSVTFLASALLVWTLPIVTRSKEMRRAAASRRRIDFAASFRDLRDGWSFIVSTPVVRAVMVGLGTGMIGGGMMIPLGELFAVDVVGAGDAGFGLLLFALGLGVAIGVSLLSLVHARLPRDSFFVSAVLLAGVCLIAAATLQTFFVVFLLITCMGLGAGAVYVLGFTILHETVEDELRGRVFASLYVVIRFCVLIAIGLGPLLASGLDLFSDALVDGQLSLFGADFDVPGVRLALWLAGSVIVVAAFLSAASFRQHAELEARRTADRGAP
ncbi:MAG: MFS transporter [Actinomycetota bacterium]